MKLLIGIAAFGGAYWLADMVLDKWIIKSDTGDPTGFVVQSEGFGLDDVARIGVVGLSGALVCKFLGRRAA